MHSHTQPQVYAEVGWDRPVDPKRDIRQGNLCPTVVDVTPRAPTGSECSHGVLGHAPSGAFHSAFDAIAHGLGTSNERHQDGHHQAAHGDNRVILMNLLSAISLLKQNCLRNIGVYTWGGLFDQRLRDQSPTLPKRRGGLDSRRFDYHN